MFYTPALALGIGQGVSSFVQVLSGLISGRAENEEYNQRRIAEVQRQNLQIFNRNNAAAERYRNLQLSTDQQLRYNRQAELNARAMAEDNLNRALSQSLRQRERDTVEMFRSLRGARSSRVNLDSSTLAEYGRAQSARLAELTSVGMSARSKAYLRAEELRAANDRATAALMFAPAPLPYINSYRPQRSNPLLENLMLASGAFAGIERGYSVYNKLMP
ncbi:hypothetical protein OMCYN_01649 [cyanobiont of Ornithocercus magnificus]|nr:hypothetical protein OMCYN_01649 [cyanobiont of Ornithocercus magnificus]